MPHPRSSTAAKCVISICNAGPECQISEELTNLNINNIV
jgi:hypothetical protein